jgi:hypothetical protein
MTGIVRGGESCPPHGCDVPDALVGEIVAHGRQGRRAALDVIGKPTAIERVRLVLDEARVHALREHLQALGLELRLDDLDALGDDLVLGDGPLLSVLPLDIPIPRPRPFDPCPPGRVAHEQTLHRVTSKGGRGGFDSL